MLSFLLQKMVNGGVVNNWICINFSRVVQDSVAHGFCHELAQMCCISGMVWCLKTCIDQYSQCHFVLSP